MRRFFLKLIRRRRLERDLEAELALHRELSKADFGNPSVIKEQAFDLWRFNTIENLWRDIVYGIRGLRHQPALVATALLSLALGIGANTALFSLGMELLFSEPSVTDPESLAYVRFNGNSHINQAGFDAVVNSGVFQEVAGMRSTGQINWNDGVQTRPVFRTVTTRNFFTALGAPVRIGRPYTASDPAEVAVLHYRFWTRHLHSDPSVVGRSIMLDGKSYTVAGILPPNFRTLDGFGFSPDLFIPAAPDELLAIYARLKPDTTLRQAQAAVQAIAPRINEAADLRERHPEGSVQPVSSAGRLRHDELGIGLFFLVLLSLAGCVLLIACANVASLLLARASVRRREIAVRLSLGASRGRLLQQLLVESLLLSVTGAAGGLLLAWLLNRILDSLDLPTPIPIHLTMQLDWRVGIYAAALSILAAVACGLLPAWQSVRESFVSDYHVAGRMLLRRAIVIGQISISIVVLVAAFLFVRNLLKSSSLSPGFDVLNTIHAKVNLQPNAPNKAQYMDTVIETLTALPGVTSVASARLVPFTDQSDAKFDLDFSDGVHFPGVRFAMNEVTPAYFRALSIPILSGRTFEEKDARRAERPVIVNRTFAERYRPGGAAIGSTFRWRIGDDSNALVRIVGVVANTKNMTIGENEQPLIYGLLTSPGPELRFILRSAAPPVSQLKPVTEALRRLDPNAGVEVNTLFETIAFAFLPSQLGAALFGCIGVLGLILALVGLYGVTSYSVARRTREIGVRMAIGAPSATIFRMVLRESFKLTAIGSAIGFALAWIATRPLSAFLVDGLDVHDPITFVAVFGVFAVTGLIASWSPARRATAIDPVSCLRQD